jgi:hypothetical protein
MLMAEYRLLVFKDRRSAAWAALMSLKKLVAICVLYRYSFAFVKRILLF